MNKHRPWHEADTRVRNCSEMGVAQNLNARVTQVLVFGSIYQGAIVCTGFLSHSQIEICTFCVCVKISRPGDRRLSSKLPFARVPCWVPMFDS